jgi:hypothetical protein
VFEEMKEDDVVSSIEKQLGFMKCTGFQAKQSKIGLFARNAMGKRKVTPSVGIRCEEKTGRRSDAVLIVPV